jgi:hypothetical protein
MSPWLSHLLPIEMLRVQFHNPAQAVAANGIRDKPKFLHQDFSLHPRRHYRILADL